MKAIPGARLGVLSCQPRPLLTEDGGTESTCSVCGCAIWFGRHPLALPALFTCVDHADPMRATIRGYPLSLAPVECPTCSSWTPERIRGRVVQCCGCGVAVRMLESVERGLELGTVALPSCSDCVESLERITLELANPVGSFIVLQIRPLRDRVWPDAPRTEEHASDAGPGTGQDSPSADLDSPSQPVDRSSEERPAAPRPPLPPCRDPGGAP